MPKENALIKGLLRLPLYVRIAVALVLGVIVGLVVPATWAPHFDIPARIILRLLGAIAPPLILVAVSRALIGANVQGKLAGKMFFLLALNTLVAIFNGLLVANVIRPGATPRFRRARRRTLQATLWCNCSTTFHQVSSALWSRTT
jgi:Na+/H+-dicarboxylate symporter